jgi:hypothetical protein
MAADNINTTTFDLSEAFDDIRTCPVHVHGDKEKCFFVSYRVGVWTGEFVDRLGLVGQPKPPRPLRDDDDKIMYADPETKQVPMMEYPQAAAGLDVMFDITQAIQRDQSVPAKKSPRSKGSFGTAE